MSDIHKLKDIIEEIDINVNEMGLIKDIKKVAKTITGQNLNAEQIMALKDQIDNKVRETVSKITKGLTSLVQDFAVEAVKDNLISKSDADNMIARGLAADVFVKSFLTAKIEEIFVKRINALQGAKNYPKAVKDLTKFAKSYKIK